MIRSLMVDHRKSLPEGFRYWSALDLVLEEGIDFTPVLFERRGAKKACFKNAGNLSIDHPDRFVYVEGFAVISESIPLTVAHAWVYDLQEKLSLEVTWDSVGIEYLGIPFADGFHRGMLIAREVWGILDAREMLLEEADPLKFRHSSDLF